MEKKKTLRSVLREEILTRQSPEFTIKELTDAAREALGKDVKERTVAAYMSSFTLEGFIKRLQRGKGRMVALYQRLPEPEPKPRQEEKAKTDELNAAQVGEAIIYYIERLKEKLRMVTSVDSLEVMSLKKALKDAQEDLAQERKRASKLSEENEVMREKMRQMTGKTLKLGDVARMTGRM